MVIRWIVAGLLFGAVSHARGQEGEPPPELAPEEGKWSGEVGAGLLSTDGNSQSRSMNAKLLAEYKKKRWKNAFQASAVNTSSGEGGTSAERYLASDKVDYLFYENNYAFVLGEYEKDLFGGTRERTSETAGVGRHFLTGPEHLLDAEIGAGARQTEAQTTGVKTSEAIARFGGKYEWRFTERNAFTEQVKVESGASDTFTESVTGLKLAVVGNLSSSITYTLRHHSDVAPDREHLDSETALNLVYDFGKEE
jgi:putative salt-induced outer membrane protein